MWFFVVCGVYVFDCVFVCATTLHQWTNEPSNIMYTYLCWPSPTHTTHNCYVLCLYRWIIPCKSNQQLMNTRLHRLVSGCLLSSVHPTPCKSACSRPPPPLSSFLFIFLPHTCLPSFSLSPFFPGRGPSTICRHASKEFDWRGCEGVVCTLRPRRRCVDTQECWRKEQR